jgi:amino-acid N-acetyltransferase
MDDLPLVLSLLTESGLPCDGVVDHFPEAYVVIREGEAVVAVAGLEPYGKGLGLAITETLLRDAVDRGFRQVFLLTTTATDFFRKLGFIETVRDEAPVEMRLSPEFAGACPSSAVCLEKLLR